MQALDQKIISPYSSAQRSSFWWIYYFQSSKSTRKKTGKTHLCVLYSISSVKKKTSANPSDCHKNIPWEIVEVWSSSVSVTIKPIWVIFQIWRIAELSVWQGHKISLEKIQISPHNGQKLTDSVLDWNSENTKTFLVRC